MGWLKFHLYEVGVEKTIFGPQRKCKRELN